MARRDQDSALRESIRGANRGAISQPTSCVVSERLRFVPLISSKPREKLPCRLEGELGSQLTTHISKLFQN